VAGIQLGDFLPDQPTAPVGNAGWQALIDYGTNPDKLVGALIDCPVYIGVSVPGVKQTDKVWDIRHLQYDTLWRLISKTIATGAWTDRAKLTYT
jgi:hypothetical protein